ncbi:mitochondrial import inner membrane translocase subunit 14 [Heterostelium album PN500]|uniref:Mitochondrial import inner membrane translocase subunit 14 n=1 Tax=Heterostelium pallidum (strain ATCC 26659 / Pp 5 / PN500) TaxID=670386 RepID=D3AVN1_HETP5|nr:mitochondrial import inner membrane translocase subunit 14 [Heterostelium album PN500]EFA86354.1 mitochondrial import inner membrane translocase subunit 14 [Heterostelium album PN500]|eukprot:XP_020438459.1 mitochondrial import inner membrane translocase subunit 14 [Heterostelium album PN500]
MATPFIIGLAVAGAAYATRGAIRAASKLKSNPNFFFSMGRQASEGNFGEGFRAKMDKEEAAAILGIPENADEKLVKETHKKLMIKNHPDRGGSSYLATKVNEARNIMVGKQ